MNQFMDEGARNWMWRYLKKNHWRVAPWLDFDDMVQEGYSAYAEVLIRYPTAIEPQHKMSLFKKLLLCRIEDLVRNYRKQVDDARSDIVEVYDGDAVVLPDFSDLQAMLLKAPKIIKDALLLLMDEKAREELQKPYRQYDSGRRETLNDRFVKLLNLDPKIDVVGNLKTYFAS